MDFLVITGMSGAGKSQAANVVEDLGYYCVDNMPTEMIPHFVQLYSNSPGKLQKVAFTIDVRGVNDFQTLISRLNELKKDGYTCRVIFIECDDSVIINRYKESRRTHPLAAALNISVTDALREERIVLSPIKKIADYVIDTTSTTPYQLRDKLNVILGTTRINSLMVTCLSFGFKYGIPSDADLVFDVRCFPNPYYLIELRDKTGLDHAVREYVFSNECAVTFRNKLYDMIDYLLPLYAEEGKNQLTIAVGCTGGKHRSVSFAEELTGHLTEKGYHAVSVHRDIVKKFIGDK